MGTGNLIETAEVIRDREIQRLKDQGRSEDEIAEARTKLEPAGEVWRLDPASGKVEWKFRTGTTVLECVAAGKDRIFFGTREGTVFCLSFDGEELAKWNACAPIVSSPAVAGALVYVVTEAGKLYALAADSLRPVWEARIGREGPFVSSPTIARGRVYVGSSDSGFLCLGGAGETGEISVWAGHLGGPGQGGTVDGSALPPRGALAWTYPERQEGRSESAEPMALTGPVACSAGRLFVPVGSGEKAGLLCLDASAAPEAVPREIWHFRTPNGVWLSPAAAKERVFCVAGREGQEERSLYCLDAAMGNVRWKKPVESRASGRFTINGTHVVVQDKPGVLSCFSLNGDPLWARSVGGIVVDVEIADGMLLVASGSPGVLRALDIGTGAELWSREAQEVFLTAPAAGKATCYVGTAEGVAAYSLVDGARLWVSPVGPVRTPLAVGPQCLVCVNASSEFLVLDAESGAVIGRLPDALPSLPPLLAEDGALFATIPEIRLYRFADRNSLCWMRTAPFGSLKSPMILADSKVYFTTDRNGLVCAEEERER
jgi:outer membrane protein assembly factor BamB